VLDGAWITQDALTSWVWSLAGQPAFELWCLMHCWRESLCTGQDD